MILIPWAASAEQARQREHELRAAAEQRRRTHPERREPGRYRARATVSADSNRRGQQPRRETRALRRRMRERLARTRPGSV
jgi:hypothetical protein